MKEMIAHEDRGRLLLEQKQFTSAIPEFKAALQLNETVGIASSAYVIRLDLADALFDAGRYEEAIAEYRRAHETGGYASSHLDLADALKKVGRVSEACGEWKRVIELDTQGDWAKKAQKRMKEYGFK